MQVKFELFFVKRVLLDKRYVLYGFADNLIFDVLLKFSNVLYVRLTHNFEFLSLLSYGTFLL